MRKWMIDSIPARSGHEFAFATLAVCPLRMELPPSERAWRSQLLIAKGARASSSAFRECNGPT
jgi:hypothetical protein